MQQPTLLILAAGMASRYGSMKQIQAFGPGFKKVVFIIRKEFAGDFKEIFEPKLKGKVAVDYVYQDLHAFTDGYQVPADRTKPWGTAHAVLCAKAAINEPFAVINADDFYGRDAFEKAYQFLTEDSSEKVYAIIGYDLMKTLSDNGTVNRGVCQVDAKGNLTSIAERLNIANKDGKILCDDTMEPKELPVKSSVSMNFWCFSPSIFPYSEQLFHDFLAKNLSNPKSEFFIPIVADEFINKGDGAIKVIPTAAQWFGVTYKEDAPEVKASLDALVAAGEYPDKLWP